MSSKELPSSPNTGNYKTVMHPICVLLQLDASMAVVLYKPSSGPTDTDSQQVWRAKPRLWSQGLGSNPESP